MPDEKKKTTAAKKTAPAGKAAAAKKTTAAAPAARRGAVPVQKKATPVKRAVARPVTRAAVRRPARPAAAPEPAAPAPKREPRPLPTAPAGHAPVIAADGSASGSVALPEALITTKRSPGVLFQAFQAARANARLGTAATRNRTRVRGGGAKPYRQKGTGRARQGSIRSPQFRHGAVVFGPNGRAYWHRIPERMRKAAFAEAFSARAAAGRVIVYDDIGGLSERPRSREVADWLSRVGDTGRTLIVSARDADRAGVAVANLSRVELCSPGTLRLVDLLRIDTLLVARPALDALAARAGAAPVPAEAVPA